MLVVTHEMGFARDVADRVIFMADGSGDRGCGRRMRSSPRRANQRTRQFLQTVLERSGRSRRRPIQTEPTGETIMTEHTDASQTDGLRRAPAARWRKRGRAARWRQAAWSRTARSRRAAADRHLRSRISPCRNSSATTRWCACRRKGELILDHLERLALFVPRHQDRRIHRPRRRHHQRRGQDAEDPQDHGADRDVRRHDPRPARPAASISSAIPSTTPRRAPRSSISVSRPTTIRNGWW